MTIQDKLKYIKVTRNMNRLTRKGRTEIHLKDYVMNGWIDFQDCLNKLGQWEDLEEQQLGCSLELGIKALNFLKGIIGVEEYKEGCYCLVDLCSDNKDPICDIDEETYKLFKEKLKWN